MTADPLDSPSRGASSGSTEFSPQSPVSPDAPAHLGQPDLRYSIEQFYFDQETDSRFYLRRIEQAMLETAGPAPRADARALDVACGTGKQMARLQALGWRACGIDASDDMLRLGLYISKEVLECNRSLRSLAEVLPFRDGSFDLVLCQGSMDHFAQPQRFIGEAARILAPGGRLVVALANYDSFSCLWGRYRAALLRRFNPRAPDTGYWRIPFDHTFKGTYLYLRRLRHPGLVRRRLYGISLFQFLWAWRKLLSTIPPARAGAAWHAIDRVARRLAPIADTVVAEWEKR